MPPATGDSAPSSEALTWQLQDYLEAIAQLQRQDRVARAKDIATRLGVTRGTVTSALHSLGDKGLINYQPYGHITLTPAGEAAAAEIIHRHRTLSDYFHLVLRMPRDQAEANACRAEHVLDDQVIAHMARLMEMMRACPGPSRGSGRQGRRSGTRGEASCRQCLAQCPARPPD